MENVPVNVTIAKPRPFLVFGWAFMIVFFVSGLIGSFAASFISSLIGVLFFGGMLAVWIRMGWRGAKSSRERIWGGAAVFLILAAIAGITALVIVWQG